MSDSKVKDGGPAFPTFETNRVYRDDADRVGYLEKLPVGGMSLRDYFAAAALPTVMAKADEQKELTWAEWLVRVSDAAYDVADAMLAERVK